MEEYNSVKDKNIETDKETNGNGASVSSYYGPPLTSILKKIISFICYGPGVLGFLWLIGRILKR